MSQDPKKEVSFSVWDNDEGEFVEMYMDEDAYQAMVDYEEQMEFERQERRARLRKEENAASFYDRGSD